MITFDKLWETLKEKGITQYRLINYYGVSPGQLTRLKRNQNINTHTIDQLCYILDCVPDDIMEYIKENPPYIDEKKKPE